jgi:hypothetical protein
MKCAPAAVLFLAFTLACGCECGRRETVSATSEAPVAAPEREVGFIVGIVRLEEGAELPRHPSNPLQIEGRNPIPAECTPPREVDRTPVIVADETGGLVGLSIVGTGPDEQTWPRAGEPVLHELTIRDCRLSPSILVATRGDRVRISNATDYPFFPNLGEGVLQALLRAEPREITLGEGGIRTIECGFAAPCGRADVITLYHPVHTVTGADGRFRLEVPADTDVRVTAWHPFFEEANTTARVAVGETREIEFTIRSRVIPAPAPRPEPVPGDPDALL